MVFLEKSQIWADLLQNLLGFIGSVHFIKYLSLENVELNAFLALALS